MSAADTHAEVTLHPSVEELRSISIFSDLPQQGLEWLANAMTIVEAAPGQIVIHAGEPADRLFVILRGEIAVDRDGVR
ncbi:MAG: cyclic nucleotide-binding domain-containing protein, partial [Acidobacteriales bacterium]|nr:cyclic nucleotide-binding domain-containing protein [Terriglobales bacterium]